MPADVRVAVCALNFRRPIRISVSKLEKIGKNSMIFIVNGMLSLHIYIVTSVDPLDPPCDHECNRTSAGVFKINTNILREPMVWHGIQPTTWRWFSKTRPHIIHKRCTARAAVYRSKHNTQCSRSSSSLYRHVYIFSDTPIVSFK